MSNDDDIRVLTDSVLTMVEDTLDTPVQLEIITVRPDEMPQMMVQTLPAETVKTYKNGDYIGRHNWNLYLRIPVTDTAERIDAIASLSEASALIRNVTPKMPAGFAFDSTKGGATPVLEDVTESFETYRVTFRTEYKRSKERN